MCACVFNLFIFMMFVRFCSSVWAIEGAAEVTKDQPNCDNLKPRYERLAFGANGVELWIKFQNFNRSIQLTRNQCYEIMILPNPPFPFALSARANPR